MLLVIGGSLAELLSASQPYINPAEALMGRGVLTSARLLSFVLIWISAGGWLAVKLPNGNCSTTTCFPVVQAVGRPVSGWVYDPPEQVNGVITGVSA